MRWLMFLLMAMLLTVVLSLVGCRELGGARQGLEQGEFARAAVKPPSGAVDDFMRGAKRAVQEIELEGEDTTARKIEDWAEKGLTEVVDKGPDVYDAYTRLDGDLDGHWDSNDNCPDLFNPGQDNSDGWGSGDACDGADNADSDSRLDFFDNCPNVWNSRQADLDGDNYGDACDVDMDGDGVLNTSDVDMDGDGYDYTIDIDNDGDFMLNEDDHFDWTPAYY